MSIICLLALVFTLFYLPSFAADDHDIHICVTELRYNPASGAFEVSVKIFIDDLELALAKTGVNGLAIGTDNESKSADSHIAGYLRQHLKIVLNGQTLEPEFLGKEQSEDFIAIWCYVQFKAATSRGQRCVITNDIFFELYDDQKNLMDIRMHPDQKEYAILQPGSTTWSYTY